MHLSQPSIISNFLTLNEHTWNPSASILVPLISFFLNLSWCVATDLLFDPSTSAKQHQVQPIAQATKWSCSLLTRNGQCHCFPKEKVTARSKTKRGANDLLFLLPFQGRGETLATTNKVKNKNHVNSHCTVFWLKLLVTSAFWKMWYGTKKHTAKNTYRFRLQLRLIRRITFLLLSWKIKITSSSASLISSIAGAHHAEM